MKATLQAITGVVLLSLPNQITGSEGPGKLEAKVMLVSTDLSVRPAPKKPFQIDCQGEGCNIHLAITTSFEGYVTADLPPGPYTLASAEPIEFEGSRYSWKMPFEVVSGGTVRLELSNDNANVEKAERPGPPLSEGALFAKVKQSVFKVISESGSGSGFLVDARGLIITNHHVVKGSDYLAVKIDEKRKYPAVIAAEDSANDIAVLRVNPVPLVGLEPLPLTQDTAEKPSVTVGERVIAVGSPLATETILTSGLVSKIEEGAIYSDVSINPGSSGGPLFNMLGEVIGITTFGLQAEVGPGVAGIVRVHVAKPVVERACAALDRPPPSDKRLAEVSDFRFPPGKLKERAVNNPPDQRYYHVEAGKIDVQFITPVIVASLQVSAEREASEGRKRRTGDAGKTYTPGTDFYEWRRYVGDYRPVVVIQAVPEISLTGGSIFAVIIAGANAPQNYKFKTDFERMELTRDGVVVEPILPGRSAQVVSSRQGVVSMHDVAYYGAYEYPPEAFRPGASVVLKIWEQGKEQPKVRPLDTILLNRIYGDFWPYFEELERHTRGADASHP